VQFRILHNEEPCYSYRPPDIVRMLKSRWLWLARCVSQMGDTRNAFRIIAGKPLGWVRRIWDYNIMVDVGEIYCEG